MKPLKKRDKVWFIEDNPASVCKYYQATIISAKDDEMFKIQLNSE